MTHNRLGPLWAPNNYDLRQKAECCAVGRIAKTDLRHGIWGYDFHRPRDPLPPQSDRTHLPFPSPKGLKALYEIARDDMFRLGFDPDSLYVHTLYQAAPLWPSDVLREGHWHFDLYRNLRHLRHRDHIPLSIGYGVSSILPTVYATHLRGQQGDRLPARPVIQDPRHHQDLGRRAECLQQIFQAEACEVVRYNNLVLHRGEPNRTNHLIHRVFMHVAFSPIGKPPQNRMSYPRGLSYKQFRQEEKHVELI